MPYQYVMQTILMKQNSEKYDSCTKCNQLPFSCYCDCVFCGEKEECDCESVPVIIP